MAKIENARLGAGRGHIPRSLSLILPGVCTIVVGLLSLFMMAAVDHLSSIPMGLGAL